MMLKDNGKKKSKTCGSCNNLHVNHHYLHAVQGAKQGILIKRGQGPEG